MDHRPDHPLNDPALGREIESLLAVEPSPEFLARVRTRIANEPEPSRWRLAWIAVPAMGMCVVLFATVLVTWPRPEPAVPIQAVISSPVLPTIVEREPAVEPSRVFARVATQKREQPTARSEEHTSELQSQSNLVCRLLLEKKKKKKKR